MNGRVKQTALTWITKCKVHPHLHKTMQTECLKNKHFLLCKRIVKRNQLKSHHQSFFQLCRYRMFYLPPLPVSLSLCLIGCDCLSFLVVVCGDYAEFNVIPSKGLNWCFTQSKIEMGRKHAVSDRCSYLLLSSNKSDYNTCFLCKVWQWDKKIIDISNRQTFQFNTINLINLRL